MKRIKSKIKMKAFVFYCWVHETWRNFNLWLEVDPLTDAERAQVDPKLTKLYHRGILSALEVARQHRTELAFAKIKNN